MGLRSVLTSRRTLARLLVLAVPLAVLALDFALRGALLRDFTHEAALAYAQCFAPAAIAWAALVVAAARRRSWTRWAARVLLAGVALFAVGTQLQTYARYRSYLNWRTALMGNSLAPFLGQELWGDRAARARAAPRARGRSSSRSPSALRRLAPPAPNRGARGIARRASSGSPRRSSGGRPTRDGTAGRAPTSSGSRRWVRSRSRSGPTRTSWWSSAGCRTRARPEARARAAPVRPRGRGTSFSSSTSRCAARTSAACPATRLPEEPVHQRAPARPPRLHADARARLDHGAVDGRDAERSVARGRARLAALGAAPARVRPPRGCGRGVLDVAEPALRQRRPLPRRPAAARLRLRDGARALRRLPRRRRRRRAARPRPRAASTASASRTSPSPSSRTRTSPTRSTSTICRSRRSTTGARWTTSAGRASATGTRSTGRTSCSRASSPRSARVPGAERTVVVFLSDHGEQIGEHGQTGHTWNLYDDEIRVPMWIDAPAGTLTDDEAAHLRAARGRAAHRARDRADGARSARRLGRSGARAAARADGRREPAARRASSRSRRSS